MIGLGPAIKAITTLIVVVIVAGGLWYVTGLRADLAVSEQNQKTLTQAIEAQKEAIETMKRDLQLQQEINRQMADTVERQKKDISALSDRFSTNARGEKRDFGAIAAAKPDSIERAVNRGTVNALRCFEIASGAELNEKERTAKTSKDLNPECPNLVQPLLPSIAQ